MQKKSQRVKVHKQFFRKVIIFLKPSLMLLAFIQILAYFWRASNEFQCSSQLAIKLVPSVPFTINKTSQSSQSDCYQFYGSQGQVIKIDASTRVEIKTPHNQLIKIMGTSVYTLSEIGTYTLKVGPFQTDNSYQMSVELQSKEPINSAKSGTDNNFVLPPVPNTTNTNYVPLKLSYNVKKSPPFQPDIKLQKIVDEVVSLVKSKKVLSTDKLGISLVNLSDSSPCCHYGSYSDQTPIFPASVSKLFWLVGLYAQYKNGILPEGTISEKDAYKMIQDSNNNPASRVVDVITGTQSGENLPEDQLENWINKRLWINQFFYEAGYDNINISQKNFPIPAMGYEKPEGRDLQMRKNLQKPVRNFLTSYEVARLLYEIHTRQAVSKEYSEKIESLMLRDLNPAAWKSKEYNSIEGFFAESLPLGTYVASKVGWTFDNRCDAAIIATPDRRTRYILVILADDPGFANDWKIFPEISRLVYDRMLEHR